MFPLVIVPNATLFIFIIAFYKGIGDSLEWTWARAVLGYRVGVCVVWRCSAGQDCVGHCRCRYMPAVLSADLHRGWALHDLGERCSICCWQVAFPLSGVGIV